MPTYSKPQSNRRAARPKGDMRSQARANVAQEYISRRPRAATPGGPTPGGQVPFPRRNPQPAQPAQPRPGVPPWGQQGPGAPTMSAPSTPMRYGQGGTFSPQPPPAPSQYGAIPTQPPQIPQGGFRPGGPMMMPPPWMQQGGPAMPMQGGAFQPPPIPPGGFGVPSGSLPQQGVPAQYGAMNPQPPSIPAGGFQFRPGQTLGGMPSTPSPMGTPPPPGSYDPNRGGGGWGGGFGY